MTELSPASEKKAAGLITDAPMAILVGLIPMLGFAYLVRLIQWYRLRAAEREWSQSDDPFARQFRSCLPRFWFAILFWPIFIVVIILYFVIVNP